jgi:16S rRNA C967 or C1407 C5-methylase (RsmB/RsmF family)
MTAQSSLDRFKSFYQRWYSPEQLQALNHSGGQAALNVRRVPLPWEPLGWFLQAHWVAVDHPDRPDKNSSQYYTMDAASLLPVLALDPLPGEAIADICAAPGGKTLAIATRMGFSGRLLASDLSADRVKRLRYNLRRLGVPDTGPGWALETMHASANVIAHQYPGQFDKVLIDAPCSSEAHVINDSKELSKWSTSKSSLLAKRQRKLIQSAMKLLKPGGRLVYATCSISPLENQDVITFMLKKFPDQLEYVPWPAPMGQLVEYGNSVFPWEQGMGPGYCCTLFCK